MLCTIVINLETIIFKDSFHVQLVGGVTQNVGRVEVKYDDIWSDVCYEQHGVKPWSFYNAQVVCRELGFPGAMFARRGGHGRGTRESVVYGYNCKDGKCLYMSWSRETR